MNFPTAIKTCFRKSVTFSGRASRSEYWWFALFGFIISWVMWGADFYLFGNPIENPKFFSFTILWTVLFFLPICAADVRRLHDIDRRGWPIVVLNSLMSLFILAGPLLPEPGNPSVVQALIDHSWLFYSTAGFIVVFVVTMIGMIVFSIFQMKKGTIGDNRFGPYTLAKKMAA